MLYPARFSMDAHLDEVNHAPPAALAAGKSGSSANNVPPGEVVENRAPAWLLSKAATSASTACPNGALAPLRKTSVNGSENVPGWVSWGAIHRPDRSVCQGWSAQVPVPLSPEQKL
jgi:hypothetical protein